MCFILKEWKIDIFLVHFTVIVIKTKLCLLLLLLLLLLLDR